MGEVKLGIHIGFFLGSVGSSPPSSAIMQIPKKCTSSVLYSLFLFFQNKAVG
jgi:hypothetical protein